MAKVSKKFDSLSDIVPNKDSIRIMVRVLRVWSVPAFLDPSQTSSVEMVLVDETGAKIHASIRKQLLYMFESKIEEGEVYQMSYFSVIPSTGYYRTTLHPYKLIFQLKTKVQVAKSSDISEYGLTLTSLSEVCAHTHDYEFLVDVMGLMTGISVEREYLRDGKITKMVIVELTDAGGKCECALFGDYVDELSKKMGKSAEGLPVVVIQFAKVKIFRDNASIQNVINTTRIFVNPDIPEAIAFRNSIAVHGIELESTVPLIGGHAKPSLDEEFLRMHPKKKVADLAELEEEGVFAVYGIVTGIVGGQEWWYTACKCHRSVIPDSGAYYCSGCSKHVFQVVPRFKVKIEVSDGDATSVFVLFDSDMSYIMEKSCAFFVGRSKGSSDCAYPVEFDLLIGKKMLFTVDKGMKQATLSDGSYRVKRVCMDSKIIDTFCSEGPYFTPVMTMTLVIDVASDESSDDVDVVPDSQPISFLKDIIVTPPEGGGNFTEDEDVIATVKRNLNGMFDDAAAVGGKKLPLNELSDVVDKSAPKKRLRRIKIEKD